MTRFNGSGDAVRLTEAEGFGTLEMNSTGANQLIYDGTDTTDGAAVIFNQPGEIVHASNQDRLQTAGQLVANAAVGVDLSNTYLGGERRMLFGGLAGSADISITGTPTDPTAGTITRNEFEIGTSSEPANGIPADDFSGTVTASSYVDMEVRRDQRGARFVVGNNATLEMGHQEIFAEFSVEIGEIRVQSGGRLIVGYEADGGHNPYLLTLRGEGARNGDLTLDAGSRTVMQINGTNLEDFDRIVSEGNVAVGGTLEILINPNGVQSSFEEDNDIFANTYAPTLGDTFDLITLAADPLAGDYNGDAAVDGLDYDLWASTFGSTEMLAADGNGDGAIDAADYTIWRDAQGATGEFGALSGVFSGVVVTDPGSVMAAAGLAFELTYTATKVQLRVVSASAVTVPEPTAMLLLSLGLVGPGARRCRA